MDFGVYGFHIDCELHLCDLLNRQTGGHFARQNPSRIDTHLAAPHVRDAGSFCQEQPCRPFQS
jgi:hypothetical protein